MIRTVNCIRLWSFEKVFQKPPLRNSGGGGKEKTLFLLIDLLCLGVQKKAPAF